MHCHAIPNVCVHFMRPSIRGRMDAALANELQALTALLFFFFFYFFFFYFDFWAWHLIDIGASIGYPCQVALAPHEVAVLGSWSSSVRLHIERCLASVSTIWTTLLTLSDCTCLASKQFWGRTNRKTPAKKVRRKTWGCPAQCIGLASDGVTKLSNAWQRGKLVLNKGSVPYKSMLGEKSLTWRSSLFLRGEVRMVLTTPSQLSASHFKRYWGSDKCGAVLQSIDDLPTCFCMGPYLCLEPILPVATPVVGLWRSTCKPYVDTNAGGKMAWNQRKLIAAAQIDFELAPRMMPGDLLGAVLSTSQCSTLFSRNAVSMETSAIGWPPWLITFW